MTDDELFGNSEQLDCSDCVNHGGDWDCDHVHCHIGTGTITDSISRAAVLDEIHKYMEERDYTIGTLYDNICEMPSVQPVAKDIYFHAKDCISRAAAVEALNEYFSRIGKLKLRGLSNAEKAISLDTVGAIKSLPSAQPVEDARAICGECDAWNQYKNYPHPGWIPCSRELPKEEERSYWVCMEDGYQKQCRWKRYEGKDCYIYAWHSTMKVIAWMPLPAPYLPEGEERECID